MWGPIPAGLLQTWRAQPARLGCPILGLLHWGRVLQNATLASKVRIARDAARSPLRGLSAAREFANAWIKRNGALPDSGALCD